MRPACRLSCLFLILLLLPAPSRGQGEAVAAPEYETFAAIYGAPGNYGMMYGAASFGRPRTWSGFSSSYGGGYGYGYPPARILPGPWGGGLWRAGDEAAAGFAPGSGFYRTIRIPYTGGQPVAGPPVGVYAPDLGPPWPIAGR